MTQLVQVRHYLTMKIGFIVFLITYASSSFAAQNPWSKDATLPGKMKCFIKHNKKICLSSGNRKNILNRNDMDEAIKNGSTHALSYPVTVSELQVPFKAVMAYFNSDTNSPIRRYIYKITQGASGLKDIDQIYKWVGLHKYPKQKQKASPNIIYNLHKFDHERMGATITETDKGAKQLTFSCAACHSSDLFGVKVLGMSNRFPRANEFFYYGKKLLALTSTAVFKGILNPSKEEIQIYKKSKNAIRYINLKKPKALGLDTSLAQVGLSLAKRADDKYASRKVWNSIFPRKNKLSKRPADSKPAVWWNLKYKTKWLSDGSVRSGNPVFTNFLWNEIGRGTDLRKLETWLDENQDIVDDLTSYVFNTEPPKYNDFFPNEIDIAKAKRGQTTFRKNCISCHGDYEKGWELNSSEDYIQKIKTTKTWYHTRTVTIDVGTDPYRYEGMEYFYKDLNKLQISKSSGAVVTPQKGYVPPPLVGVWARWPYFHNNSAPTLYDVLTPDYKRPKKYYAFEAIDKDKDFDKVKNGYPTKKNDRKYLFDTTRSGLSNVGHTFMLIDENGQEKFSHNQKIEIIEFLKTL